MQLDHQVLQADFVARVFLFEQLLVFFYQLRPTSLVVFWSTGQQLQLRFPD